MNGGRIWIRELLMVLALIASLVLAVRVLAPLAVAHPATWSEYTFEPWVWILVQYAASGAFGGLLLLFAQIELEDVLTSTHDGWSRFNSFAVAHCCVGGIGGAYAWLFILLFNGNIAGEISLEGVEILKNCTSGVVAGFIGFALLKHAANTLKKFADLEALATKKAESATAEINKEIARLRERFSEMQNLEDAIRRARTFREKRGNHKTRIKTETPDEEFINIYRDLSNARRLFPEHRTAAIVLANLDFDRGRFDEAVRTVTECIEEVTKHANDETRKVSDKNIADLLYNRACYRAAKYGTAQATEKDAILNEILADLRRSVALSEENWDSINKDLQEGGDLYSLAAQPRMQEFLTERNRNQA